MTRKISCVFLLLFAFLFPQEEKTSIWNGFNFGMSSAIVLQSIVDRLIPEKIPRQLKDDDEIKIYQIEGTEGRYDSFNIPSTLSKKNFGLPLSNTGIEPRVKIYAQCDLPSLDAYSTTDFYLCEDALVIMKVSFKVEVRDMVIASLTKSYGTPKEIIAVWSRWDAWHSKPPQYVREETKHLRWESPTAIVDYSSRGGSVHFIDKHYLSRLLASNGAIRDEADAAYRLKEAADKKKAADSIGF